MYKWHVHLAIGRGRPLASDPAKVADGIAAGIAASLRQFSVSAKSSDNGNDDGPRISRSHQSRAAWNEISSFAPQQPRGIDARSLAATPAPAPGGLKITRFVGGEARGASGGYNGTRTRGPAFGFRGGLRGGGGGFRGGARGGGGDRGRGGVRGVRGKGKRGGKRQKKEKEDVDEFVGQPYTEEELAYLDMSDGGFPTDWKPETTAESLSRYGPAVVSSPRGIQETVAGRIMVATSVTDPSYEHASIHLARMEENIGTLFEDAEQKKLSEKYHGGGRFLGLTENQKANIMKQWVAGQYTAPGAPAQGNVLARTRQMTRRNETYLPGNSLNFEKTLRSLLPQDMRQAQYEQDPPKAKPAVV